MTLEQVYDCPRTLAALKTGPLGDYLEGFCDHLLDGGFSRCTIRRHLSNTSHLNDYLGTRNIDLPLSGQAISEFFRDYPRQARSRGLRKKHIDEVHWSINRLVFYLKSISKYRPDVVEVEIYQPLLIAYLNWLKERQGVAPGTLELRSHYLCQFLNWLGPDATVKGCLKLSPEWVENYFISYAEQSGRPAQRSMQATLRTFFRFCLQQGIIRQPLDQAVPKISLYSLSTVARGLSDEQAIKVLQCIDRDSHEGRRNYAICQLLYTYGVRAGQVCQLRFNDIDWVGNQIRFRALKKSKEVVLPLTVPAGESLLEYLRQGRPAYSDPYVFLTLKAPYHGLNNSRTLSNMVAHYIEITGIDVTCKGAHAFRHGFASRMLEQGESLKAIADMLGHRHLSSTFHYAKIDFNHLKQVALPWPKERLS